MENTLDSRAGGSKINFLQRMKLWQKFTLLGVLALVAVAAPYIQFVQKAQSDIEFAATELSGIAPLQTTTKMLQLLQQHRGLTSLALGATESNAQAANQARLAKQAEAEKAMAEVELFMSNTVESKIAKERWIEFKDDWKRITSALAAKTMNARQSYDEHTEFLEDITTMIEGIADHYLITLDPTAHTYFMGQTVVIHLPALAETLGQMRALGSARLAEAARLRALGSDPNVALTGADRAALEGLAHTVETIEKTIINSLRKAADAQPSIKAKLESVQAVPIAAAEKLQELTRKELVQVTTPSFDAAAYLKTFTEGIDAQFKFQESVMAVLQEELTTYQGSLRKNELLITAEILAVVLVVAAIAVLTVRNITGTVSSLQDSVDKVRQGDFAALGHVEALDEVGDLGRTVNLLLQERIGAQKQAETEKKSAEDENEKLNNSVISILQAVHQLSQKDLTAKAPVTQDVIGTVSDSINLMTDETAKVLHGVNLIAGQVAEGSGKVKTQADLVSKTSEEERKNVGEMMNSLADANESVNQVAALAEQSNNSAEQATTATRSALEAVDGTVKGMESIRETISETEKRIKRLGERSQEISGIVNLINTISERTHVLALNASMQAAVAGEAGRGFAVVAEEVQRLAESSRNATQQIGTLVSNIQLETNETIATVNRTIGQVVQGSEQAQKAGEQMRQTQQITGELVANVRRISVASDQQKDMSAQLLASVQNIGQSTERTAQQISAQNVETDSLVNAARRLVESVAVFKLPAAA